jgi:hypothetical protein
MGLGRSALERVRFERVSSIFSGMRWKTSLVAGLQSGHAAPTPLPVDSSLVPGATSRLVASAAADCALSAESRYQRW